MRGTPTQVESLMMRFCVDREILDLLAATNRRLRPRERMILRRRDGDRRQTFEELAERFDVSRTRIMQIEARAVRKIRRDLLRLMPEGMLAEGVDDEG